MPVLHFMRAILTIVSCLILGVASHAQLKWDTQKVELTSLPTDAAVDSKFGFVNAGDSAVTIEAVQSSCGCTIPTLEKKTYAPGERGALLAHFLVGDRRGKQEKTIRVQIQGEREPALLTLIVNIPEILRVTPPILIWEQSQPVEAKTFTVQAQANLPVLVNKVTSTNPEMDIKVETVSAAREYRVTVTPKSAEKAGLALVTIETTVKDQPKSFPAYLQIKPKPRQP